MIIESLAKYLEDNGFGTRGSDIFIGELPLDVSNAISLIYTPSPTPNQALEVYEQVIDVWGRYDKTDTGYAKMLEAFELLHQGQNYEISDNGDSYHVYFSNAQGMIEDLDRDSERRRLYRLSLRFIYRKN